MLKTKRNRKKNKAGQAFLMAAFTLHRSNHWLGATYRRIAAKNGAPIAIKATARKLAIILYQMITKQVEFCPLPIVDYNQLFKERKIKYIKNQALMLGPGDLVINIWMLICCDGFIAEIMQFLCTFIV